MAGTAKNYDITRLQQGPGDLWIIGGGVADSATPQLTIFTDGTPDATAHPASVHLGGTDGGISVAITSKIEDITIDQADGPVARYLTAVEMAIEAAIKQLDPTIIQQCASWLTYATSSGYKQATVGGAGISNTTVCLACISARRGASGKYDVAMMFAAQGVMGPSYEIGRSKSFAAKVQFKGLSDLTRTAGRQIGVVYQTI